jgi:ribosomal protein L10
VYATDFDPKLVDILPASDPNAMTESQRIAKAQIELETAMRLPQIHDQREAVRRFYVAIGAENIDALLPNPDEGLSADPLSEIQAAIKGKPIKAQMGQNHQAHIAVKELFLQQPQMQGSNDPTVAIGKQLILSNVGEHKMLMFVSQIAQVAMMQGLPLNDERVQMVIAQQMLAQNQPTGGQPSVEQQMLANEKRQLDQTDARQELQAVTAAAKIEKDRDELALKTVRTLAELKQKEDAQLMKIAENLLDYASKKSQSGEDRLEQLANDRFGTRS